MSTECHNYTKRCFEAPAIEPPTSREDLPLPASLHCDDCGLNSTLNDSELSPEEEEPSSVELTMVTDQQELCNGELQRRICREDRLARVGIVPDPIACDVIGRPLVCTLSASETAGDFQALVELAAWHENMFSQYQHLPCVTVQESLPL